MDSVYRYFKHMNTLTIMIILITILMIMMMVAWSFTGESEMSSSSSSGSGFVTLFIIIMSLALFYYYRINISGNVNKTNGTELDIVITTNTHKNKKNKKNKKKKHHKSDKDTDDENTDDENTDDEEVFHVANNKYNYRQAWNVCNSYGGRLANWREIYKAYKKGGEWCGYGWSANQMALFPTQYETWAKLQTIPGHRHDCGRPGVNGGYIANPNIKFGANCYGRKPGIIPSDMVKMNVANVTPEPDVDESVNAGDNVNGSIDRISVAPFNQIKWSMY